MTRIIILREINLVIVLKLYVGLRHRLTLLAPHQSPGLLRKAIRKTHFLYTASEPLICCGIFLYVKLAK